MTKTELVKAIADQAGLTIKDAEAALNAFIGVVTKTIKKGDSVTITGFGTFQKVERKAREGVNPQTGAKIKIPKRMVPKFKPGKVLKDSVK